MNTAYLLIGGNMGDRKVILTKAKKLIYSGIGIVKTASKIYETAAWGIESQAPFLNQVLEIESSFTAEKMLAIIHKIETQLGRKRFEKWHKRTIDIDILYYNTEIINTENLVIPHPEIPNRKFTLIPLAEIAPNLKHPILKKTQSELLAHCADKLEVKSI